MHETYLYRRIKESFFQFLPFLVLILVVMFPFKNLTKNNFVRIVQLKDTFLFIVIVNNAFK